VASDLNALFSNQEQQVARLQVTPISINRVSGAVAAGNAFWQTQQAQAVQRYASQLSTLMQSEITLRATLAADATASGVACPFSAVHISDAQASVARHGFPAPLSAALTQLKAGIEADRLGYDTLWTWDHLYPLLGDSRGPNLEGWLTIVAWAARTERVRIGLLVGANTERVAHEDDVGQQIDAADGEGQRRDIARSPAPGRRERDDRQEFDAGERAQRAGERWRGKRRSSSARVPRPTQACTAVHEHAAFAMSARVGARRQRSESWPRFARWHACRTSAAPRLGSAMSSRQSAYRSRRSRRTSGSD
jgi:hypothetical protein